MTPLNFSKYSGCGNDFILIDNRTLSVFLSPKKISQLCARTQGIGADGLIFAEPSTTADVKMRIINADGSEAAMCGNGIRCLAAFIKKQGWTEPTCTIESLKGCHHATWDSDQITITMSDPADIRWDAELALDTHSIRLSSLDTGVPHAVIFCENLQSIDLQSLGPQIRYHPFFGPKGTNVNFVHVEPSHISIRTYERGVEGETEACGTGATAAAIAAARKFQMPPPVSVQVRSGEFLKIGFALESDHISNVTMSGSCSHVFDGMILI